MRRLLSLFILAGLVFPQATLAASSKQEIDSKRFYVIRTLQDSSYPLVFVNQFLKKNSYSVEYFYDDILRKNLSDIYREYHFPTVVFGKALREQVLDAPEREDFLRILKSDDPGLLELILIADEAGRIPDEIADSLRQNWKAYSDKHRRDLSGRIEDLKHRAQIEITGIALDRYSRMPVPRAKVVLIDPGGMMVAKERTDSNGFFKIRFPISYQEKRVLTVMGDRGKEYPAGSIRSISSMNYKNMGTANQLILYMFGAPSIFHAIVVDARTKVPVSGATVEIIQDEELQEFRQGSVTEERIAGGNLELVTDQFGEARISTSAGSKTVRVSAPGYPAKTFKHRLLSEENPALAWFMLDSLEKPVLLKTTDATTGNPIPFSFISKRGENKVEWVCDGKGEFITSMGTDEELPLEIRIPGYVSQSVTLNAENSGTPVVLKFEQAVVELSGKAVDAQQNPLSGVSLFFVQTGDIGTGNDDGFFSLPVKPEMSGKVKTLLVAKDGHFTQSVDFTFFSHFTKNHSMINMGEVVLPKWDDYKPRFKWPDVDIVYWEDRNVVIAAEMPIMHGYEWSTIKIDVDGESKRAYADALGVVQTRSLSNGAHHVAINALCQHREGITYTLKSEADIFVGRPDFISKIRLQQEGDHTVVTLEFQHKSFPLENLDTLRLLSRDIIREYEIDRRGKKSVLTARLPGIGRTITLVGSASDGSTFAYLF